MFPSRYHRLYSLLKQLDTLSPPSYVYLGLDQDTGQAAIDIEVKIILD